MNQRLFQDAGGTTPAIIAGQPVGLIKRLAGSADAVQATALSKPTLARWPKSGVFNLANSAQAVSDSSFWPDSRNQNGLIITKTGYGIDSDDGVPFVDYSIVGTSTGTFTDVFYASSLSSVAAAVGEEFNGRASVRLIGGAALSNHRMSVTIVNLDAGGNYLSQKSIGVPPNSEWQGIFTSSILPAGTGRVRAALVFNVQVGDVVDISLRIKGFQFGRGATALPFQFNYNANDITQTGVADLWHLYNDGGDSLNVTLPAGTYGLASIDINRAITVTTITSDGTTPINTLRHERQLDVILRAGAFSSGEEIAIRDYWGRVFA